MAILAKMRGANHVDAIDIDEWCYLNTQENIQRNDCDGINALQGDVGLLGTRKYDIILANINRNILLRDIPTYVEALNENGLLLLSGFYTEDLSRIKMTFSSVKMEFIDNLEKNNWVAALYQRS